MADWKELPEAPLDPVGEGIIVFEEPPVPPVDVDQEGDLPEGTEADI